ncbi:MAG: NAD(P)-dependent oxidoreductase [Cytophagales bacterium]
MEKKRSFKFLIAEEIHVGSLDLFNFQNVTTDYSPNISREDLKSLLPEVDGLLIRKTVFDEELIELSKNLKFVARAGAGVDNIRVDLLKEKGIALFSANEANKDAVAEHTIGLITNLLNKINLGDRQVKQNLWDREFNRGLEISGKTISIIGFGNMGSALAQRLSGWQCDVLFFDKQPKKHSLPHVRQADLDEIFEKTDILSLHLPLDSSTKHWFDEQKINSFKKPIFFFNTARGEITKLSWLKNGIINGKLKGLGLDVFDKEPIKLLDKEQREAFEFLSKHDAVLMTPHVAGWSVESYEKINKVLSEKISAYLKENKIF